MCHVHKNYTTCSLNGMRERRWNCMDKSNFKFRNSAGNFITRHAIMHSLCEHSPTCTWNFKHKEEWCFLLFSASLDPIRFFALATVLFELWFFFGKLNSFVTIDHRSDLMWTYLEKSTMLKKHPKIPGNALSNAVLKSCLQKFAVILGGSHELSRGPSMVKNWFQHCQPHNSQKNPH
jgi:hypothetical protein